MALAGTVAFALSLFCLACSRGIRRNGIPSGAQAVLDKAIEDIDAGRYEKLYHEAADEWRNDATLDESRRHPRRIESDFSKVAHQTR